MSSRRRPLVAITGRPTVEGKPWRAPGFGSPVGYVEALERAGAIGAVLMPSPATLEEAAERLEPFDGLLLSGGPDVDPARYGQEPHPATYGVHPEVDDVEAALLQAALARGMPTLAICRGLQLVNVTFGGTLHQHIDELGLSGDHGRPAADGGASLVSVSPHSRLAAALGTTEVESVCYHHQSVDRVGGGLVVTARAADGTVEGLELAEAPGWFVAVQWHPELAAPHDRANQALFDRFASLCSEVAV